MDVSWPELRLDDWKDTCATLHRWTQIVGKVRLEQTPYVNHWWQVPLYLTSRGLTTSPIPYGYRTFDIDFDFIDHILRISASDGATRIMKLTPRSVAHFYQEFMAALHSLDIDVKIYTTPVEIPDPIPFEQDEIHAAYEAECANRWWRIMLQADRVFKEFRGRFIGKCSPAHFFWGSFDLAVTRFSGRRAPERPNADLITREAYSHEVISAGLWPGGGSIQEAAFYCYAAPEPPGFAEAVIRPETAAYNRDLNEYVLMYDDVRRAAMPEETLLAFLQTTYEAGAALAQWDRQALERQL